MKHPKALRMRLKMERGPRPDFIHAYVFDTRSEMRAWLETATRRRTGYFGRSEAVAHAWQLLRRVNGRWRLQPDCGFVAFHRGQRGVGIVAHEMTHAAHYYLERRGFRHGSRQWDEKMAWTVGWLVHQFTKAGYRRGVYS